MKTKKEITVKNIIEECGGPALVAKHFNITTAAVMGWAYRDSIPPARVDELYNQFGISARKLKCKVNKHGRFRY